MMEVLQPIETWIATNLPGWAKHMPPPSKAVKVIARFNVTGVTS